MRLIDTSTLELKEFPGDERPPYTILSHTWGEDELSFQSFGKAESHNTSGFRKVKRFCQLSKENGWNYAWVDTCCIDKTSSAELSEAINSMYRWYRRSQVCYVYLADVSLSEHDMCTDSATESKTAKTFHESSWFCRGWTLQELLAPPLVIFHDRQWTGVGTSLSLRSQISRATGISEYHMQRPHKASIAQRMSWACGRRTTRVEDRAYSLMGLFAVNLPLLYGEGEKSFLRLQEEIIKSSEDESIFAWRDPTLEESGVLATSPDDFALSGDIVPIARRSNQPYTLTNQGLAIELCYRKIEPGMLWDNNTFENEGDYGQSVNTTSGYGAISVRLACARESDQSKPLALWLSRPDDQGRRTKRVKSHCLTFCKQEIWNNCETFYIHRNYSPTSLDEDLPSLSSRLAPTSVRFSLPHSIMNQIDLKTGKPLRHNVDGNTIIICHASNNEEDDMVSWHHKKSGTDFMFSLCGRSDRRMKLAISEPTTTRNRDFYLRENGSCLVVPFAQGELLWASLQLGQVDKDLRPFWHYRKSWIINISSSSVDRAMSFFDTSNIFSHRWEHSQKAGLSPPSLEHASRHLTVFRHF